jgi:dihydroflavonol-4-reductase
MYSELVGADHHRSIELSEPEADGYRMKMSLINTAVLVGPPLGTRVNHGMKEMAKLIDGSMSFIPKIKYDYVDVRDAAFAHLIALEAPDIDGEKIYIG